MFLAFLAGSSSATSPGECKLLCNDMSQSLPRVQMCQSALKSSPASASMNYHHCLKGRSLSLRKTCLPMCMNEEITLTSFDVCSAKHKHLNEISFCRRGYENTFDSMKLLLGVDQDQESVTPIHDHDESINVATSIEEESLIEEEFLTIETIIESEEVPMKNESVSLMLDHSAESSLLTFDDEEKIILQVSTTFNMTNDTTPLITNSSNTHIERSLTTLLVSDQYFTHTVPCLGDGTNLSFVKDDASYDISVVSELDLHDSIELLPAVGHDTLDASIVSSAYFFTSTAAVFIALIIVRLVAVHCWALLVGIISCLKSTTLGCASFLTTRSTADSFQTIISFLRSGVNTTTNLIRILLLQIDSLLNIPRWISHVYGPSSYGRSVFDIMFNSNPKQGPKQCKVASTFITIYQCLLDTGQASLLKLIRLPFDLARLVQVSAIISYVLVRSVAVSISKDVGVCLHTTRDALVDMIHLIRVSIVKSYAFIHSAVVLPFIKATRDCLYHIQAFIFGMARRTNVLVVILYTFVHSVAATVSTTIGCCLYFIRAPILGLARRTYVFCAISYTIALLVIESISQAVRGCIHSIQTSIFGMARRIQVFAIISYVLARSITISLTNDVGGCLYHIQSPLFGILLVPYWYWKEFGPYSQGRTVFDILFKSNPQQRRRVKRGSQVVSRRLDNIETYTSDQYPPWHIYKQFDPGISSTIHRARSCIAIANELLLAYWLYIRVSLAAVYFQDELRGYSGFILWCGSLDSSLHYIISYDQSLHQS